MLQLVLALVLLPWAPTTLAQYYDDGAEGLSPYNSTDGYMDAFYGYDTSYFATLQDPYDFSKSWTVEGDEACEGENCPVKQTITGFAHIDQDIVLDSAAAVQDPQYMYDNCVVSAEGKVVLNGTRECDLEIGNVNYAMDLIPSGVEGTYQLAGCFDGKPLYVRFDTAGNVDRTLFYSAYMGDWELSIGSEPNEDQLAMYGDLGYTSPLDVPQWHVSAAFSSVESQAMPEDEDLYFVLPDIAVTCVGEQPPGVQQYPGLDQRYSFQVAGGHRMGRHAEDGGGQFTGRHAEEDGGHRMERHAEDDGDGHKGATPS